jgi:hypothetical protein
MLGVLELSTEVDSRNTVKQTQLMLIAWAVLTSWIDELDGMERFLSFESKG